MADLAFNSKFGPLLEAFISVKQASGYPYVSPSAMLYKFDQFAHSNFPADAIPTKNMCLDWMQATPSKHPNGLFKRITPIRQFCKYLVGLGYDAYIIPSHIPNKQVKYEAHIYTKEELTAFFNAIDRCPASPFSPTRRYVIPLIFRLLYCCGLRSSEARLLNRQDVDLATGKVIIRESKGWKSRIIYMRFALLDVCRDYDTILDEMHPRREAFFPNMRGKYYSDGCLDIWFHEFWDGLPEAKLVTGNSPRVHDFRHSYSVHKLNQWVTEGRDIDALYPYLSEYLGHSNYADTDYYLSLVEEFYPEMEQRLSSLNDDILPEVCHEEE